MSLYGASWIIFIWKKMINIQLNKSYIKVVLACLRKVYDKEIVGHYQKKLIPPILIKIK